MAAHYPYSPPLKHCFLTAAPALIGCVLALMARSRHVLSAENLFL